MKKNSKAPIVLSAALILAACNIPASSAPGSGAISTAAAQTVQAALSAPAVTTPLMTSPAITSIPKADCQDAAKYTVWTRDNVTFDAKVAAKPLAPKTVFTISWTFQNSGTCTWNNSYRLYFDSGTSLTQSAEFPIIPIGEVVGPGGTVNVDIPMTAPDKAGDYETVWRLQNDRGESLLNMGVPTRVGATSSQSLASPGDLKYTYDCTTGTINISLSWVDKSSDEDGFSIYRDGNKLGSVAAGSTAYNDILPYSGKFDYTVAAFNAGGESPSHVKVNTSNCN